MIEFEELLAVATQRERMQSRRLAKGAAMSDHAALLKTLEKAAGGQDLCAFVAVRRAALTEQADARRVGKIRREARRVERANEARRREVIDASAWRAWFDGSALPNPGRLGIGGLLIGPLGQTVEIRAAAGQGDSSAAEYLALIAVLEAALREGARDIVIHGDSRVVIDDMQAADGAGIRSLAHHAACARALVERIGNVRLQWIPRARNARADALARAALDPVRSAAQAA